MPFFIIIHSEVMHHFFSEKLALVEGAIFFKQSRRLGKNNKNFLVLITLTNGHSVLQNSQHNLHLCKLTLNKPSHQQE